MQRAVRERMNRPIFLIDVSVPRNIDPTVRDVDNAFLFDIDDLEMHVEQNREERRQEAVKAEEIVREEVGVFLKWVQSLEATPTIVALRRRAEQIKEAELEKVLGRLGNLSSQERSAVEGLASAIVNKLLHGSLVALKSAAQSSNGSIYIEAARQFYHLEELEVPKEVSPTDGTPRAVCKAEGLDGGNDSQGVSAPTESGSDKHPREMAEGQ